MMFYHQCMTLPRSPVVSTALKQSISFKGQPVLVIFGGDTLLEDEGERGGMGGGGGGGGGGRGRNEGELLLHPLSNDQGGDLTVHIRSR